MGAQPGGGASNPFCSRVTGNNRRRCSSRRMPFTSSPLLPGRCRAAASMILTLTFCVMQCFWHPLEPTDSGINLAIDKASLGVTIAFTVEIVIKCLAWGFVLDDGESLGGAWEACTARLRGACALCLRAGSAPERDAQLDRLMSARRARNLQLPERPGPLPPPRPPELQRGQPSELLPPWPSGQMQPEASQQLSEQLEVEAPQQQQCRRDDYGRPSAAQPDVAGQQHTAPNGGVLDPAVTVVVVDGRASVDLTLPAGQPNGEPAAATAADGSAGGGAAQQPRQMSALERRRSRKWQRRRPFLRDGWNRLDFVVIIASWITFLPGVGNGAAAARSLRLLLALRSITLFPGMKVGPCACASGRRAAAACLAKQLPGRTPPAGADPPPARRCPGPEPLPELLLSVCRPAPPPCCTRCQCWSRFASRPFS